MMYDEDMVVRLREWCENPQDVSLGELAENSCKIADEIERMGREMDLMDYSLTEGSLIVDSQKETLDKLEKELDNLTRYRNLVWYIANDYNELSHEKVMWQRDEWKKICIALRKDIEND